MSGLDILNARLNYRGGIAEARFQKDKLNTLKKALLYSYQACTIVLNDEREFRALINTDKVKGDYDDKIISIPYKDICLNEEFGSEGKTSQAEQEIGLKIGDVFLWKETNTHWIVYLEMIQEDAYFRAEIRRCDQQTEVNGTNYWTYIRGPQETSIVWNQKGGVEWNDLNYSLVMYITKDENTIDYFHRFTKVKINDETGSTKTWQVVSTNPYYGDGIIQVFLDEYFENTIKEAAEAEEEAKKETETTPETIYISGAATVDAYSYNTYTIENSTYDDDSCMWVVYYNGIYWESGEAADVLSQNNSQAWIPFNKSEKFYLQKQSTSAVEVEVNIGKGTFTLQYVQDVDDELTVLAEKEITVS